MGRRDNLLVDINDVEIGNCMTSSFISDLNRAHVLLEKANFDLIEQTKADNMFGVRSALNDIQGLLLAEVFETAELNGDREGIVEIISGIQSRLGVDTDMGNTGRQLIRSLLRASQQLNVRVFQRQVDSMLECFTEPDIPTRFSAEFVEETR